MTTQSRRFFHRCEDCETTWTCVNHAQCDQPTNTLCDRCATNRERWADEYQRRQQEQGADHGTHR